MAVAWTFLTLGLVVMGLFLARLWTTLPPDPVYRRRVGAWLALLAIVSALYSLWVSRHRLRPHLSSPPGRPIPRDPLR